LYQNKLVNDKRIYITPDLVSLFKVIWNLLVVSNHTCNIAYPFYHLRSSSFWKLIPKRDFNHIKLTVSFSSLNASIECAVIDDELCELMMDNISNSILQEILLETYFPQTKDRFKNPEQEQTKLFSNIENIILKESPAEYKSEVKKLIEQNNEEEIYLRGGVFKREIPKIYNNTCCISGMRIDSTINISMIDACHIVPFSESYDDTITNGIALCPNLHRAFDRGLISINENYEVIISGSRVFKEESSDYGIRKFERRQILLPDNQNYYPSLENLKKHRSNYFKLN
jgi:putative restriction endonuclease